MSLVCGTNPLFAQTGYPHFKSAKKFSSKNLTFSQNNVYYVYKMPKLTLENEKTTFTEEETLTAHAVRTLGPKHKVFIARLKDGSDSDFLLFKDQKVIYGSKQFEDVAVHIDVLGLIKDIKGNHG